MQQQVDLIRSMVLDQQQQQQQQEAGHEEAPDQKVGPANNDCVVERGGLVVDVGDWSSRA
jgi:hypothetical protein